MRWFHLCLVVAGLLACPVTKALAKPLKPKHPVLYVVGLGDAGNITWKDFTHALVGSTHPRYGEGKFWAQAKNDSGPPGRVISEIDRLLPELQKNFFETFKPRGVSEASQVKVVLYGRSYGAVLVRDYLSRHTTDNAISGVLMEAGPFKGAEIANLAFLPNALLWTGIGATMASGKPWYSLISVAGLVVPFVMDRMYGLNLDAGGIYALRPTSVYLRQLKHKPLPTHITYVNVIQTSADIPAAVLNWVRFNRSKSDGVVSVASQRLGPEVVSNFEDINITQVNGQVFHWSIPEESLASIRPYLVKLLIN